MEGFFLFRGVPGQQVVASGANDSMAIGLNFPMAIHLKYYLLQTK